MSVNTQKPNEGIPSPVLNFFYKTNVFITGCTGFLGLVHLEKLLMSCRDISNIYVLIRIKKGKDVQERLDELFENVLFSRLREEFPKFREKLVPVEGDLEMPDLGLSMQDRDLLMKEVNIVFHLAATVRFDEALRKASYINVRAVRDIMRLAQQMVNLKSFVHVSTAYSNCIHKFIKEEVYPPSMDYRKLLKVTEELPEDTIVSITPMLIGDYPNTYSFTKQIGEDVVRQEGEGLPVGILRPSIVTSTYHEPIKGWCNNLYGPSGIVTGCGLGLIRAIPIKSEIISNLVPADMVVNSIIVSAWDIAEKFARDAGAGYHLPVYNFEASQSSVLTWGDYINFCTTSKEKYCSVKSIWLTVVILCHTRLSYQIVKFFLHTIPAFLLDTGRWFLKKPPMFMKLYKKVDKMFDMLHYFVINDWVFESHNISELKSKMADEDRKMFFCDMKQLDWQQYMDYHLEGLRAYVMEDPLDTLPQARQWYKRLYWMHQITKALLATLVSWILWRLYLLIFT